MLNLFEDFLTILIFIVSAILILYFPLLILSLIIYLRFRLRNVQIEKMTKEFGLSFQSFLPPASKFWIVPWRDLQLNLIEGRLNNHVIKISDKSKSSFFYIITRGWRETQIEVDGKRISGTLKDFSLGNPAFLTTLPELKKLLDSLSKS